MPTLSTIGAACARAWGFTSGLVKDQYFNLVSLLLPGNGTNGAQNNTFLDSSTNNFTITRNGNTTQGTFSPFSQTGWGGYFNGSSSLTPSSGSFLALGTSNYTIEFWIYLTQNVGNNHALAINATNGLVVVVSATKTSLNQYGVNDVLATGSGLSVNTWNHVAIVRAGTGTNQTSIYINGSRSVQGTDATNWTVTTNPRIGGNTTDQYIFGYMSNVRVVTSAIYSGASITVPTTPLTAISGTTFLTLQNNRFLDNGSTAATFTTTGSPSVTPFSPFAPTAKYETATVGGSGYFDGSGDFLTVPNDTAFAFGSGTFTIEAFIYLNASGGANIFQDDTTNAYQFYVNTSNKLEFTVSGVAVIATSSASISTGQWYHVAVVRSGTGSNQVNLYINGVSDGSGTSATTMVNSATNYIGRTPAGTRQLNGYISGLRVVKGTAITPPSGGPTAPLTAVSGTSLLLNFTNAGVVDATAKNDLETVGNAQISTAQSKWGGGSIAFDGNGDGLYRPNTDLFNFGTGNFTIEFWLYYSSKTGYQTIASLGYSPGASTGWLIQTGNGDGKVIFYVQTSGTVIASDTGSTVNTGQWYHIAIVRNSGTTTIYRDGTSVGSGSDSTNYSTTGVFYIGGGTNTGFNGGYFNGYIDDFRITRGLARYTTTSFTPPTAPFPVQ